MNNINLNPKTINKNLDRAKESYPQVAYFYEEIANRLLERLDYIKLNPIVILNCSADRNYSNKYLSKRYRADPINLDFGFSWLKKINKKSWWKKTKAVCGDPFFLPFKDQSVDLIFSNLWLSRVTNIDLCLKEFKRILKPTGLLLFTLLGQDTLKELNACFVETGLGENRCHRFVDMHNIGDFLVKEKFTDPVVDMETIQLYYKTVDQLFEDIKYSGNTNARFDRPRGLVTPRQKKKLLHEYEKLRQAKGIPVTFEIIYGHAWGSEIKREDEILIPVEKIQRR